MKNKSIISLLIIFVVCVMFSVTMPLSFFGANVNTNLNDSSHGDGSASQGNGTGNQNQLPQNTEVELYKDNWFDFVNEYWTKYTNAEVIDVYTLTKYTVQRVGGYNHADVEPINASNTAKMLNMYGNWSWARRPVWVKIKDRYIAASINGYPHSYDIISGNNMTGHTCIHFYMSRTHASNNWDPDHKAAVEIAYANKEKLNNYLNN